MDKKEKPAIVDPQSVIAAARRKNMPIREAAEMLLQDSSLEDINDALEWISNRKRQSHKFGDTNIDYDALLEYGVRDAAIELWNDRNRLVSVSFVVKHIASKLSISESECRDFLIAFRETARLYGLLVYRPGDDCSPYQMRDLTLRQWRDESFMFPTFEVFILFEESRIPLPDGWPERRKNVPVAATISSPTKGVGKRNDILQADAEVEAKKLIEANKPASRKTVAFLLSKNERWKHMTAETIERNIRGTWNKR